MDRSKHEIIDTDRPTDTNFVCKLIEKKYSKAQNDKKIEKTEKGPVPKGICSLTVIPRTKSR